mgnify:CR=1 FL=1
MSEHSPAPLRFLDADAIDAALTFPMLIDAIEEAHHRAPIHIADTIVAGDPVTYFVRNEIGRAHV